MIGPTASLNMGSLLSFGRRTGTKLTFPSNGNRAILVSFKNKKSPQTEQLVQENHRIPRSQLSAMLLTGAKGNRKGPHSPAMGVTCISSACIPGVGWERTQNCCSFMLLGMAGDFPHRFGCKQEEGLCLQQALQSWSKVVKNQAPSILCSAGALFWSAIKIQVVEEIMHGTVPLGHLGRRYGIPKYGAWRFFF